MYLINFTLMVVSCVISFLIVIIELKWRKLHNCTLYRITNSWILTVVDIICTVSKNCVYIACSHDIAMLNVIFKGNEFNNKRSHSNVYKRYLWRITFELGHPQQMVQVQKLLIVLRLLVLHSRFIKMNHFITNLENFMSALFQLP